MIEPGNTGMVQAELRVSGPGEIRAFRMSLPTDAARLLRASVDVVPGPAGAAALSPAIFGLDVLGRVTLREDAPGDVIWQEQIHAPAPDENDRPSGLSSPAPVFFTPFRPTARCILRKVRSKFLRGTWEDLINRMSGTPEEYSVTVRVWYEKGGTE